MIGKRLKHYEIEETLGQGGMGVVYRARDVRLDRPVALKVLKAELTGDPERRRRFLQEARSAAAVIHPAIAQVYDIDEADGVTFIAMEFVAGKTVRQLLRDRQLDLRGAVAVALQVARGMARAHQAGVVHRDLKADNIMLSGDGHAKILDFGLAKLLDARGTGAQQTSSMETVAQRTQAGTVLGTIAYMSPEQARGLPVDQRSDVFSLGIVLYEMVTGELPFQGTSPVDTLHSIAFEEARPVTVVRRNLPQDLHRIVSRCLRKRPEDRYPDAGALAGDLEALERDLDSGVQRSIPPSERLRDGLGWLRGAVPRQLAGIAAAAVAVVVVGYLLVTQSDVGPFFAVGVVALVTWRFVRNRRVRLLRRFVRKASKIDGVKAVVVRDPTITVLVDEAKARTFVRVNGLLDAVNRKSFLGAPLRVEIRDDVRGDALRDLLRGPGVAHVRDDVLENRSQ
jgi:serine/threonine protein kinase